MCRRATCKTCGKTTWAGCGQHVDQVMAGVAKADRCTGHSSQPQHGRDTARTFGGTRAAKPNSNWFARLLGR